MDAATNHLLSRLLSDLAFLASQGLITATQASTIRSNLPSVSSLIADHEQPVSSASSARHMPPSRFDAAKKTPAAFLPRKTPLAAQTEKGVGMAKALWDYAGEAPDDLAFNKGDLIVILEEVSDDWWRGELQRNPGVEGLFPTNHVEKLPDSAARPRFVASPPPPPPQECDSFSWRKGSAPPPFEEKPTMSKWSSSGTSLNPQPQRPGAPTPVDKQEVAENSKLRKVGNRVGDAALGGFGAGIGFGIASRIL